MARPDPVDPTPGESGDPPPDRELPRPIRDRLGATIRRLLAPGAGILAAVESIGTIGRRFDRAGVASTEASRRACRELLFTAPGIGEQISGVILFDETIRQGSPTAMNTAGPHPWVLTFSYSRAIQDPVLETWRGDETKVAEAQGVFAERVRLNGLARQGPR